MIRTLKKVIIFGAGPAGCALAHYFSNHKQFDVHLYEASSHLGGMSRSEEIPNLGYCDCGPHIFHSPDVDIANEWKLIEPRELVEQSFYSYVVKGSNFQEFHPYPISREGVALTNPELSDFDIQNYEGDELKRFQNYQSYMQARVGPQLEELYYRYYPEKLWGKPSSSLRAEWAPKRVEIREKIAPFFDGQFCSSHLKGSGFFYNKLIQKSNVRVNLESPVTSLNLQDGKLVSFNTNSDFVDTSDAIVVSTIPASVMAGLLSIDFNLKYRGVCIVNLVFDSYVQLPNGAAWLYFDQKNIPFTRVTNHSLISPKCLDDTSKSLLSFEIPFSLDNPADLVVSSTDTEIITSVAEALSLIPFLKDLTIVTAKIIKEPRVYPLRDHGYERLLSDYNAEIDKISNIYSLGAQAEFLYGDAQIIFRKSKDFVDDFLSTSSSQGSLLRKQYLEPKSLIATSAWNDFIADPSSLTDDFVLISEIGLNHNGSMSLAKKLIEHSKLSGASAVKFQCYQKDLRASNNTRDAFYAELADGEGESLGQLFERVHLSHSQLTELSEYSDKVGIPFFVSAFDLPSLEFAHILNPSVIKLSSMDLTNVDLWERTRSMFDLTISSTGMSTREEILDAYSMFNSSSGNGILSFLHCVSSYPLALSNTYLGSIHFLKQLTPVVGYSDHSFDLESIVYAYLLGARIFEKHFTLDRGMEGPDHSHSFNLQEMRSLVSALTQLLAIVQSRGSSILPCESSAARKQKKGAYYASDLPEGHLLTRENIVIKPPLLGLNGFDAVKQLGKPLSKSVLANHPLDIHDFT